MSMWIKWTIQWTATRIQSSLWRTMEVEWMKLQSGIACLLGFHSSMVWTEFESFVLIGIRQEDDWTVWKWIQDLDDEVRS